MPIAAETAVGAMKPALFGGLYFRRPRIPLVKDRSRDDPLSMQSHEGCLRLNFRIVVEWPVSYVIDLMSHFTPDGSMFSAKLISRDGFARPRERAKRIGRFVAPRDTGQRFARLSPFPQPLRRSAKTSFARPHG